MDFKIYCDGSCKGNQTDSSVGAFAYVLLYDDDKIFEWYEVFTNTTNQRMELAAALEGAKKLKELVVGYSDGSKVKLKDSEFSCRIYSDSAYLINCYTQKWWEKWVTNGWINSKKEPVKNQDLWEPLIEFFKDSRFTFIKVKGHAEDKWNNYVDTLAQNAAEKGVIDENFCN